MIVAYFDDDITISLEWVEELSTYSVHTKVNNWSLSKYKEYLLIFAEILNNLEKDGITKIFAVPTCEKVEKFSELFGFKDTGIKTGQYKIMMLDYGK